MSADQIPAKEKSPIQVVAPMIMVNFMEGHPWRYQEYGFRSARLLDISFPVAEEKVFPIGEDRIEEEETPSILIKKIYEARNWPVSVATLTVGPLSALGAETRHKTTAYFFSSDAYRTLVEKELERGAKGSGLFVFDFASVQQRGKQDYISQVCHFENTISEEKIKQAIDTRCILQSRWRQRGSETRDTRRGKPIQWELYPHGATQPILG